MLALAPKRARFSASGLGLATLLGCVAQAPLFARSGAP